MSEHDGEFVILGMELGNLCEEEAEETGSTIVFEFLEDSLERFGADGDELIIENYLEAAQENCTTLKVLC
jgi:hypothetical protein